MSISLPSFALLLVLTFLLCSRSGIKKKAREFEQLWSSLSFLFVFTLALPLLGVAVALKSLKELNHSNRYH